MFVHVASKLADHQKIVIEGWDLGVASGAMYVALIAAWVGSILSSPKELGFRFPGGETVQQALA